MPAVKSPSVRIAQRLCCDNGILRGYGIPRLIRKLAPAIPSWRNCELTGPDGRPFVVDLGQGHFHWVVDGWRTDFIESIVKRLPRDAVIFDIGANIGVTTRAMAQHIPQGRVYSFEPSVDTFGVLEANARVATNVRCERTAIGATTGTTQFSSAATDSVVRHVLAQEESGGVAVPMTRLDDFCASRAITRLDFIKIDVEGYEEQALIPAEDVLRRFRPQVIFEYFPGYKDRFHGTDLFRFFQRLDYKVRRLDETGGLHENLADNSLLTDYLAMP